MTDDPNRESRLDPADDADERILEEEGLPEDQQLADEEVAEAEPSDGGVLLVEEEAAVADDLSAEQDAIAEEARPRDRSARRRAAEGAALGGRASRNRIVVDPALRIRDRVSELFVVGVVLVFALIFLNAMAFGHGGALSPTPTPEPTLGSFAPLASPSPTPLPVQTPFQVPPKSPSPGASVEPAAS